MLVLRYSTVQKHGLFTHPTIMPFLYPLATMLKLELFNHPLTTAGFTPGHYGSGGDSANFQGFTSFSSSVEVGGVRDLFFKDSLTWFNSDVNNLKAWLAENNVEIIFKRN